MWAHLFFKGCLIGFSVAIPVGPIGMLCIRHSLTNGQRYGFAAGLGAALADAFYGTLAAFGMTMLCTFFAQHQVSCQLIGASFLFYLGFTTLFAKPNYEKNPNTPSMSYLRVFLTTFLLTLTNPLTVLSFMGIYAAAGINMVERQLASVLLMPIGIFMGSVMWWLILSSSASMLGKKVNFKSPHLLNQISGMALIAFGFLAIFFAFNPHILNFSSP